MTFGHNINYCVAGNWRRLSLQRIEQGGDKGQVEFHLEDFLKEEPVERRSDPGGADWMHTPEWEAVQDRG